MVLFSMANLQWFGQKTGRKWLSWSKINQFWAFFRSKHGELAIKKGTILFVLLRSMIFVFESLDFVEYWRSYERLKFTQFSSFPADQSPFTVFSGHLWLPLGFQIGIILFYTFLSSFWYIMDRIWLRNNWVTKLWKLPKLPVKSSGTLNGVFNGMTKIMDGGQSQRTFLLIFNFRDQSDVLCKSYRPFWL